MGLGVGARVDSTECAQVGGTVGLPAQPSQPLPALPPARSVPLTPREAPRTPVLEERGLSDAQPPPFALSVPRLIGRLSHAARVPRECLLLLRGE